MMKIIKGLEEVARFTRTFGNEEELRLDFCNPEGISTTVEIFG